MRKFIEPNIVSCMNVNDFGPFDAEIWGSVSDWVMVLVTAATLYLIYKTLKSQTEVQRSQAKATGIENEKFRISNMPRFTLTVKRCSQKHYLFNSDIAYVLDFELNNNDCKEFSIIVRKDFMMDHIGQVTKDLNSEYITGGAHRVYWVEIIPTEEDPKLLAFPIIVTCKFMDLVGNKYTQDFYVQVNNEEVTIKDVQPIRVFASP